MYKRIKRANNAFLLGSIVMFVLLLVVITLFIFASFKIYDKKKQFANDLYSIVLSSSATGNPLSVYMNDSLLFSGTPASQLTLTVGRFSQESSLLVVDGATEKVSVFTLPQESATVTVSKHSDSFEFSLLKRP